MMTLLKALLLSPSLSLALASPMLAPISGTTSMLGYIFFDARNATTLEKQQDLCKQYFNAAKTQAKYSSGSCPNQGMYALFILTMCKADLNFRIVHRN
jgi:hypothetical protein